MLILESWVEFAGFAGMGVWGIIYFCHLTDPDPFHVFEHQF